MQEWIIKGTVGLFLAINAYLDWKKQEISLISVGLFGLIGIGFDLWLQHQHWGSIAGGILLGAGVGLLAFLTKEAIGTGDGLILMVIGVFLGFGETLLLFLTGCLLCTALMFLMLLFRKIRKDSRFPLVPFLLAAYLGRMLG